ncbi:MAG: hypothetical protein ACK519_05430 [Sphingomonadaceae bacterium]|jgi:hypothetical protein
MTSVKRKAWLTVAMACICAVGTPLYAKEAPDYSAFSDEELGERYYQLADPDNAKFCNVMPPLLDEMAKRQAFQPKIGNPELFSAFLCAAHERRYKDAFAISVDIEKIANFVLPLEIMLPVELGAEEFPAAARRIIKMAGSADGEAVGMLDEKFFWPLASTLAQNKNDEIRLRMFRALADSPHLGRLPANMRSDIAQETITLDAKSGSFGRVKMLKGELWGPYSFLELLANRKLEPIWPELEEIAGPNLQKVAAANIAQNKEAYNADPDDRQAFQIYAHALAFAGKFEDAIALVRTFDHSPEAMLNATEDDIWAVNIEALALNALGRDSEADAVFDAMAALPFEGERKFWLIDFIMNRASRLVSMGRWQKGLDATMLAHQVAEKAGSPWQKMVIRRARICALVNLGRKAEAASLLVEAYDRREDGYATAARAYLCAGDDDKAAAIVLEALKNPDHQDDMAQALQPDDFGIFFVDGTLPDLRDRLKSRPEIDAAFNKIARDLPERLIPVVSLRQRQIAQGK